MCGKDEVNGIMNDIVTGSPPHVRERHFAFKRVDIAAGITPACAGKTKG